MPSEHVAGALRELHAAIAAVQPEIRGYESLVNDQLSGDTLAFLNSEMNRRLALLGSYWQAVEALEALSDTFPDVLDTEVPFAVADELNAQWAAIGAAIDGFSAPPQAETMSIDLGEPALKPGV